MPVAKAIVVIVAAAAAAMPLMLDKFTGLDDHSQQGMSREKALQN